LEPLLTIALLPNKRQILPALDYTGTLLLRWQVSIPEKGVNPLQLRGVVEARQSIPTVGFLPRGQWEILGGDRSNSPLSEIDYTPLMDWFLITPSGFKNSQLLIYPYDQPTYQLPNTGGTVNFTPPPQPNQTSTEGTPTTVTPVAGTSQVLSPPTANRLEGIIVNSTNKVVWIRFSVAPAANSAPSMALAAGGNMGIPDQYIGQINYFIGNGGTALTGQITLTEFNAQ
jgi:hypothetical protein